MPSLRLGGVGGKAWPSLTGFCSRASPFLSEAESAFFSQEARFSNEDARQLLRGLAGPSMCAAYSLGRCLGGCGARRWV